MNKAAARKSARPAGGRTEVDFRWLQTFLNSIQSYAHAESLILESPDVTTLHHYTDLAGLRGIVEAGDLWLTHLRFLNDEEELTHGKAIVRRRIEERLGRRAAGQKAYLQRLQGLLDRPVEDGVYIFCFCEEGDLLSQWRGYGANGDGVCLRFDKHRFSHLTGADCAGGLLRIWRVFYEENRQESIVDKAIDYAWTSGGTTVDQKAMRAAEAIQFFLPTFKNPDFKEEREWRLIFTPSPGFLVKPAFRTGRGMLIPYYSLKALGWGDAALPITGVSVGPGARKAINAQSVRMMLDNRSYGGAPGYAGVEVEVSKTPFRG